MKISVLIILGLGLVTASKAQSTATASSEASMIIPISIIKTQDQNYGILGASATPGTASFGKFGLEVTGGVTISPSSPTATRAAFEITGEPFASISITFPTSVTVTGSISGSMEVDEFTTYPMGSSIDVSGTNSGITPNGTLHVGANQPGGVYTNASDLFCTVNYE